MTKSGKHCGKRKKMLVLAISSFVTMFSKSRLLHRRQKAFIWGKGERTCLTRFHIQQLCSRRFYKEPRQWLVWKRYHICRLVLKTCYMSRKSSFLTKFSFCHIICKRCLLQICKLYVSVFWKEWKAHQSTKCATWVFVIAFCPSFVVNICLLTI